MLQGRWFLSTSDFIDEAKDGIVLCPKPLIQNQLINTSGCNISVVCCTITWFAWFHQFESHSKCSYFDALKSPSLGKSYLNNLNYGSLYKKAWDTLTIIIIDHYYYWILLFWITITIIIGYYWILLFLLPNNSLCPWVSGESPMGIRHGHQACEESLGSSSGPVGQSFQKMTSLWPLWLVRPVGIPLGLYHIIQPIGTHLF